MKNVKIYAMEEGRLCFPRVPLMRIEVSQCWHVVRVVVRVQSAAQCKGALWLLLLVEIMSANALQGPLATVQLLETTLLCLVLLCSRPRRSMTIVILGQLPESDND